ncbi:glycerophosphodiester phosphodiesterase [Pullulanibacillus sp. KACC 23026]|uniref:glycerophosphodiester phosphodiesterase n=1 Tax=Pullulanibacillus sp. KACC 23026 TaxID=3028315 RepID=UPI0023B1E1D7|nr:glycerophosphodiester phosphodiesterase [Pullulanibacillus sp. KACC 23026]WEG13512.1 glycerophosphodiester phosphodiesterase [Pullulanibacillus sp. KACC 23026]
MKTKIIAHRGFKSAAPENTLIAFELAKQAGTDGIELDIHRTKDGSLVVMHDETLDRTSNGRGWIKDITFAELSKLDAGSWFAPEFKGEKIPLLEDVLIWARSQGIFVNIELKTAIVEYPGLEDAVVDLINRYGLHDQVLCSSFNHVSLKNIKQLDPDIQVAILYAQQLVDPWLYAKHIGAVAIHPYFKHISPEIVMACKKYKIDINPYTVNEINDLETMMNLGVTSIITDYPDRLASLKLLK